MKLASRKSDRVVIGATEALRRATDGPALVEQLSAELGEPVRVLSGAREAALGLIGAVHRLDPVGSQILIDSGGASTELTLTDGHRALASASLPIGAALLGAELRGDPPRALSWALGAARVGSALSLAPAGNPARAWATGGTAHNLAGLERIRGCSGDQRLTTQELSALAARLLAKPARKLARHSGEDRARIEILPPGLLIIAAILAHYGLNEVTVVPEGLREGMAAAAFEDADGWWRGPAQKG
jgi:exopolyphosphatase/guanosine-5'-triphosphate,3'-diphosphate pyrophosphatase